MRDRSREWALDILKRLESGEIDYPRARALYDALTPEVRVELHAHVLVALDLLREGTVEEVRYGMPPCEFRLARFIAELVDRELADEIHEYLSETTDGAWCCPCPDCRAFADRLDAATARIWAAV